MRRELKRDRVFGICNVHVLRLSKIKQHNTNRKNQAALSSGLVTHDFSTSEGRACCTCMCIYAYVYVQVKYTHVQCTCIICSIGLLYMYELTSLTSLLLAPYLSSADLQKEQDMYVYLIDVILHCTAQLQCRL